MLTGGDRSALARQQTMRALIDWSYDLLADEERALFRKLAIFACGFTLEAASAVGADDGIDEIAVLDLPASLVDKSLVQAERVRQRGALPALGVDATLVIRKRLLKAVLTANRLLC